jgi:biopolymer transport protein ExbD
MISTGIPLLLALIWGGLMVFVWKSISSERQVTKSIVAIVGGLTCLMIFRVGHMLSSLIEGDARLAAELDRIHSVPAEPAPESGLGAQKPAIREIRIHVTEAGSLMLDGRPLDDQSLKKEFTKLASENSKTVVTILSDEFAPYQRVIDVLNLLAEAKIENVTFEVPEQK